MKTKTGTVILLVGGVLLAGAGGCPEKEAATSASPTPSPTPKEGGSDSGKAVDGSLKDTVAKAPQPTPVAKTPAPEPVSATPTPKPTATPKAAVETPNDTGEPQGAAVQSKPDAFKLHVTLTKDGVVQYDEPTYFVGDQAIELGWSGSGKLLASYNLADMSWWEGATGNTFDLPSCQDWAQTSMQVTRESLEQTPDSAAKDYVLSMLDPNFEVEASDDSINLSNAFYDFKIQTDGKVAPDRLRRFLNYDRLKAYRKAMLFRDHPPFMQLAIDDVLEKRGMFPLQTIMTVKTEGAESVSEMIMRIEPLEDDDWEMVRGYIE